MIGQTLSHYKILHEISRGGMGIVYKALDLKLNREVALKVLPPELVSDPERKRRFVKEAQAAAALKHPNIAVVYEIDEVEGETFIAMELIEGATLGVVQKRESFPLVRRLDIAIQVAEGLNQAHEKGIVHRDLKPGNIMVTEDGEPKIIDFGLAKLVESPRGYGSELETAHRGETSSGHIMGTLSYRSPEQVRGQGVDHRSDVFSFGVVLYEMLTGEVPFKAPSLAEIPHAIIHDPVPPLRASSDAHLAAELQRITVKCLAKDPNRRYQTMKDLVVDLRAARDLLVSGPVAAVAERPRRGRWSMALGSAGLGALAVVIGYAVFQRDETPSELVTPVVELERIAILPFENIGPSGEEYLADGITDEIRARLGGLSGLAVIGRQSSIQYKGTDKSAQQIGEELGADFLLGGTISVRQSPEGSVRVRVRPQLTKASDATQQWAEVYDEDITDPFQLETEIARKVIAALDITLLDAEQRTIQEKPTDNLEAYQYYLRGKDQRGENEENTRIIVRMYENAVALDPDFALAHALLSQSHSRMYWFFYDHSSERLVRAKEAVDTAFQLESDLPEAHMALGYYHYWGHLDYESALDEFRLVQRQQPNNGDLFAGIGFVRRRQGQFEDALENMKKAAGLDSRSAFITFNIGGTYHLMRNYPEAERYYDRAILLNPDGPRPFAWKAWLYLDWHGDTEMARDTLGRTSHGFGTRDHINYVLRSWISMDVVDGKYKETLDRLSSVSTEAFETQSWFVPKEQLYGHIYGLMNQPDLERRHYDAARALLESRIEARPEDSRLRSALGITYAGLGRKEDAIHEGKLAVDLLPLTKEAIRGAYRAMDLAQIYTMTGELDAAIDQLEHLLSIPSPVSVPQLRLDPVWIPLRGYPQFQRLLSTDN